MYSIEFFGVLYSDEVVYRPSPRLHNIRLETPHLLRLETLQDISVLRWYGRVFIRQYLFHIRSMFAKETMLAEDIAMRPYAAGFRLYGTEEGGEWK